MACDTPIYILPKYGIEKVPVPCGRCPPCKIRRVNTWVFRLMQEHKISTHSHFVTLTYDTNFVPISPNGFMTLKKSDFQNFVKRLRKMTGIEGIKYYACGEYGSKNSRPHYHAIFFNVPDSKSFADAWSLDGVQIGTVHVGQVSGDSVAYTMKYIDKSQFVKRHSRDDRVPEFALMSKGLGSNFLTDEMKKYYADDLGRMCLIREGGHKIAMPRFYRQKMFDDQQLLEQRHIIADVMSKQLKEDIKKFNDIGYPDTYTYDMYKSDARYARNHSFYSRSKERDI